MKKLLLLAGLAIVLAGSIAYAYQESATNSKDSCTPNPSCPAGGDGCCKK